MINSLKAQRLHLIREFSILEEDYESKQEEQIYIPRDIASGHHRGDYSRSGN
jgi:hypothetical protein